MTTTVKNDAMTKPNEAEPVMLKKRIGSTDYIVAVRFCQSGKETVEDKILRLIESEVQYA
jgi:hypothetical protein